MYNSTMSKKYTLNQEDLLKIAKAFGYAMASAIIAFLIMVVEQVDFAEYAFLVPIINLALYTGKRFLEGKGE